jgi:hypothetical protein
MHGENLRKPARVRRAGAMHWFPTGQVYNMPSNLDCICMHPDGGSYQNEIARKLVSVEDNRDGNRHSLKRWTTNDRGASRWLSTYSTIGPGSFLPKEFAKILYFFFVKPRIGTVEEYFIRVCQISELRHRGHDG